MTGTIAFLGPSAPAAAFAAIADAELRPPVGQGDVFRAVADGATAIGIVDGYFDSTPAVLHKEILWAIDRGIPVLGAASMGALRAAELHRHGMRGIGWVFAAYADGVLEDDDEVAIVHAPARLGYAPVSEAMVNIRRTLSRAEEERVLSRADAATLTALAKAMHYVDREWPRLLVAASCALPPEVVARLAAWLPDGRVDAKREDALALARVMAAMPADELPARGTPPAYEHTVLVEAVRRAATADAADARGDVAGAAIARWRRHEPLWFVHELLALVDALTFERERAGRATLEEAALLRTAASWRAALGLADAQAVDRWLAARGMGEPQLVALLARETRLGVAREALGPLVRQCLAARLALDDARGEDAGGGKAAPLDWYAPGLGLAPDALRHAISAPPGE